MNRNYITNAIPSNWLIQGREFGTKIFYTINQKLEIILTDSIVSIN